MSNLVKNKSLIMTSVKKSLKQENDFGFIKKEPLDEDFKNEVNQLNQDYLNQDQLNKDQLNKSQLHKDQQNQDQLNQDQLNQDQLNQDLFDEYDYGAADLYAAPSSMWSSLVERTIFLLQDEIRNKHPNHSVITKILIKEVNNLLSDVEKFFQECWNPIKDEEEIKDSLEIDGKLALCIPCHNQIFPHYYELCNDLPISYSETIFSPLTIGNEWNALEDNNVDYFAPDVKIDVKQEFNDSSSVVKKTKKSVKGKTINKKEYICDLCGKVFKLNDSLKNHVRVKHEQKKIFKCRQCKKSFSYQTGLREHRGVCKGPSKEKRWIYWGKHSHRCEIFGFFLLSFPQNERKIY